MKLLLDQDVYEVTASFLIGLGFDVVRVVNLEWLSFRRGELAKGYRVESHFVTRDRDYGDLVFVKGIKSGVLYLRVVPAEIDKVHSELERVLMLYDDADLKSAFVVVEAGRHRFRTL